MSSFTLHTEISIVIYVPYPKGSRIRDVSNLPPALGSGLVFSESGAPKVWTTPSDQPEGVPYLPIITSREQIFSAHELRVSNRVGDKLADPCLESAPTISESLSSFVSGVTETSAVSFTLLNPRLQFLFSNEFITTRSLVKISRVIDGVKTLVWRGTVNRVGFDSIKTTINARPELKQLDNQATFGFDSKIPDWGPSFDIPIVCARLIPYSIDLIDHPPVLVNSYENWLADFTKSAEYINNITADLARDDTANLVTQIGNHPPDYVTYAASDLIQTRSYPITSRSGTPSSAEWAWVRVERGIFIYPSEDEKPLLPGTEIGAGDHHKENYRESLIPKGADDPTWIVTNVNYGYVPFQLETGFSYCNWGVLGLSDNRVSDSLYDYPDLIPFVDSEGNANRPAHPLDGFYTYNIYLNSYTMFVHWTTHSLSRFYPVDIRSQPAGYYADHWATFTKSLPLPDVRDILRSQGKGISVDAAAIARAERQLYEKSGSSLRVRSVRSKDMFSPNSQFEYFQSPNTGNDDDLLNLSDFRFVPYTFRNSLVPNPDHKGGGVLKVLPSINTEHRPPDATSVAILNSPNVNYERSKEGGGAYFVSADYPIYLRGGYKDLRHAILRGRNTGYGRRNPAGAVTANIDLYNQVIGVSRLIYSNARDLLRAVRPFNLLLGDLSTMPVFTPAQVGDYPNSQGQGDAPSEFRQELGRGGPRGDGEAGICTFHGASPYTGRRGSPRPTRTFIFDTDLQAYAEGAFQSEDNFGARWDLFWPGGNPYGEQIFASSIDERFYYILWGDRDHNLNIRALKHFDFFFGDNNSAAFPEASAPYNLLTFTGENLSEYDLGGNTLDRGFNEEYWSQFAGFVGGLAVTNSHVYIIDNRVARLRIYNKRTLEEISSHELPIAQYTSMFFFEKDSTGFIAALDNTSKLLRIFGLDGREQVGSYVLLDNNYNYTGADVSKDGKTLYLMTRYSEGIEGAVEQGAPRGLPVWKFKIIRRDFEISRLQAPTQPLPNQAEAPPINLPWDTDNLPPSYPTYAPELNEDLTYEEGSNDTPPRELWNNLFSFYYHHDMIDANDAHLRPTTFVYSVIKNAGLRPGFKQDGSDVEGTINDHKMQLIEQTTTTYRDLLRRVLPSLGYIVRFNYDNESVELVDIATRKWEQWNMGDDIIQLDSIEADFDRQYSSFIFENDDMTRGKNTLEEWKDDPNQQGRFTIFNSNPFVNGKTLTMKTGTWTSEYKKVATILSLRRDRYKWRVSNFHLVRENGKIETPRIGDIVRLNSKKIPAPDNIADVLVTFTSQSDAYSEFEGVSFG